LNTADDDKIARKYLKSNKMTFPIILDTTPRSWAVHEAYETLGGMTAVPLTYLIGRDGKVVAAWYGYEKGRAEEEVKKLGLE
jgi:peroxiredoxin